MIDKAILDRRITSDIDLAIYGKTIASAESGCGMIGLRFTDGSWIFGIAVADLDGDSEINWDGVPCESVLHDLELIDDAAYAAIRDRAKVDRVNRLRADLAAAERAAGLGGKEGPIEHA
jgi:predicted nucleotidyltransferase